MSSLPLSSGITPPGFAPGASATAGAVRETRPRTTPRGELTHSFTAVSQVVRESGLLNRARWFYLTVGIVLFLGFGGAVTGFILLGDSWFQLLIAAALGILFTQAAFISHEAAHKQILRSGPANDLLSLIIANGVVGMSRGWWNIKHTRHHANPNQLGKDPDIEYDTISFIEEDAAKQRGIKKFIARRQGWLFFPLLTFEGLNLHYISIRALVSRGKVKDRWLELSIVLVRSVLYFGAIFWFLPLGMAFAFVGVQLAVFGVYMGASFAPNHKGMPIVARDAKLDFFSKQVLTSRNVTGGWWATALMGGLNYQVEHHLFPNMPRPHLHRASEIVKDYCETVGVAYTEATLWRSYAIVIEYLNRVGLAARDPFDCPLRTELR